MVEHKKSKVIVFLFLTVLSMFIFLNSVYAQNLIIKDTGNNPSWKLMKNENGTIPYIDDKHSSTPLVCQLYPNAKNKNDLSSRNVYGQKGNGKNKGAVLQQKINGIWADCAYGNLTEAYLQIGDNSTIFIYQNDSIVEYDDSDNPNLITSFTIQKYNGTSYEIAPQNIWIKNQTDCQSIGKDGLCFGATDDSLNETQYANYKYIINSTFPISVSNDTTSTYSSPIFSTSYISSSIDIVFQYYNFKDICNNINANCQWTINGNSATLTFTSNKYIDPTVTVSASTIFSSSIFTNVTSEGNFSHLTIDTTTLPFNNLVAYLPFDIKENSSLLNRTYDYSQATNDGTLQNGTAFNSSGLFGSCYTFDGINDYINITLTTKVASSLWERNASSTTWTFLAYNGSSYYVNGVAITGNITYPINYTATGLRIGQNRTGGTYYNGSIDEVMIFNASLSGAQVLAIYNNQTNRFKSLGHQTIQEENITSGYNSLNLTIFFNNSFGSNISGRV